MKLASLALAVFCVAALPLRAQAQNNTAATALRTAPNTTLNTFTDDGANITRWYRFGVAANRSYCVETGMSELAAANPDVKNDSYLQLFSDAGITLITSNDDNAVEPTHQIGVAGVKAGPSRICNISDAVGARFVALQDFSTGTQQWKLKINDTTLFAPWYFSGSGFEAFILIKNTTSTATTVRITLYTTAGAVTQNVIGSAPANGSFNVQVSSVLGTGSFSGGVSIASDAAPGGVVASVTSLNFGAGVSFDVPASPRQDWRQ